MNICSPFFFSNRLQSRQMSTAWYWNGLFCMIIWFSLYLRRKPCYYYRNTPFPALVSWRNCRNCPLPQMPITCIFQVKWSRLPLAEQTLPPVFLLKYGELLALLFFQLGQVLSLSLGRPTINFRLRRWTMQSSCSKIFCGHKTVPKSKVVLHIALNYKIISARGQIKHSWDKASQAKRQKKIKNYVPSFPIFGDEFHDIHHVHQ